MGRSFTSMPDLGTSRRFALPVAVWTFVLALLFGAVAPLGPPDTLVHGPAFNPATTSVAIAAKRSDQTAGLWQSVRGVRHDGAAGGGAMLALAPTLASILLLFVLLTACTPAKVLRPVRCGARGARSPPTPRC
ncbi:hypothetical protein SAMN03159338_0662 [Sphingomonas sp. NFR04]|uniref:hypothetical protein n=1 Tax=Sphingomonas sp. NFR04 TaxID=1566283 RepID=UPI0008E6113A|nr:hypothetical protein [Sphingomonas sp. NFR04]SFJ04906.1 hypothetical protein SAMN03159338_0662 [Sphingomonas sp. NFR04]